MRGHAVQFHLRLREGVLDFFGALESFVALQHVIRRLRAGSAGFFRVLEKLSEVLRTMLRAFDAGMEAIVSHNSPVCDCVIQWSDRGRAIATSLRKSNRRSLLLQKRHLHGLLQEPKEPLLLLLLPADPFHRETARRAKFQ